jgi:xanthine dehydrogenase YagR molybdenum-binding subunit
MPWPTNRRVIGTRVQRLDGPAKASGRAKYSFDINRPGMLHARIVRCPHAHARVTTINVDDARRVAGYRAHHIIAQPNTELFFAGAEVIAVAADTEEHAEDVLRAVRVDYQVLPHMVKEEDALRAPAGQAGTMGGAQPANVRPGGEFATENFDAEAFRDIPETQIHRGTYGVPVICHQCLESHGLVAEWDMEQSNLTVWCSTQAVPGTALALAQHFRIPPARVKCITHYMGGGFGSKFGPDIQGIAAAELAKAARAPVKLMLDRAEEVTTGGNRPSAYGTIRLAGNRDGTIRAFEVDCYGSPGAGNGATVNLGLLPYVYTAQFIKRRHRVVRLNAGIARAMRAPGHPQNCVLTDQAVDDLAAKLNLDPLQVCLRNLPANEPNAVQNAPQSFNALRHTIYTEEIAIARRLSGWDTRWHRPGQGAAGPIKQGIGMALHTWGGAGGPNNDITVTISRDGSVQVQSSTQDLGTGERTVLAIVVAEVLGLEPRDITVDIGESQYGRSTGSGGSTTCPGTAPAALNAANAARDAFFAALAPRINAQAADLSIQPGRPGQGGQPAQPARVINRTNNQGLTWREACARLGQNPAVGRGDWTPGLSNNGVGGVQIAEVKVDTETGVVRCTRIVAVQDCGLIINKLGCESQVAGGVIMGVNYALFEERLMDRTTGRQVNPDMEFYKLGGILDMPEIVVHMHDMPARGVIGIGEPPTISTCAAIGNAVFNAIGVRVPHAPYTPARVLAALEGARNRGNG